MGVGAFSPLSLGTSALAWWSADTLSSLALSGSSVITWIDRVAGLAPTQGTAGARPTYSATSFGGFPGVTFDGGLSPRTSWNSVRLHTGVRSSRNSSSDGSPLKWPWP